LGVRVSVAPLLLGEGLGVKGFSKIAGFVRFEQAGEEDLGRVARQIPVVIDDEWHRPCVGNERFVAAVAEVLLAQVPFERLR
jgi:hypothetical protein